MWREHFHLNFKMLFKLQQQFSSTIEHPEIFRRMISEFDLDVDAYFNAQVRQKLRRFEKSLEKSTRKDGEYHFYRQQDILVGVELFFYPEPYKEEILNTFKEFYPGAFQSCLSLQ